MSYIITSSMLFIPTRMAKVKNNKCWGKFEPSYISGGNVKWYNYFGNSLAVLQKINHGTTIWTKNFFPRYIPSRNWEQVLKNSCTWMCTAALFTITIRWNELKHPPAGKRKNRMWYIHIMECYSVIKRSEVLIHATILMNLTNVMLRKIFQI